MTKIMIPAGSCCNQDDKSGDGTLPARPPSWDSFFVAAHRADVPEDFLSAQDRNQGVQNRDPFESIPVAN
jgi:antitoxin VapB